ncbi:MAG: hypothetical protein HRT68_07520 [Flavobacteriaceae bacterium]|nr:hypothetical protein [Flavobacteriaceae bacterium]
MFKIFICHLFIFLATVNSCSKCKNVYSGKFFYEYGNSKIFIDRTNDYQISKIVVNNQTKRVIYESIKWVDSCTYITMYDFSKMKEEDLLVDINYNGGMKTEIIGFENDCYYYKKTFKLWGEEKIEEGKICPSKE